VLLGDITRSSVGLGVINRHLECDAECNMANIRLELEYRH